MWPFKNKRKPEIKCDHFINGQPLAFLDRLINEQEQIIINETHKSLYNLSAITITTAAYKNTVVGNSRDILNTIIGSQYHKFLVVEFFANEKALQEYVVRKISGILDNTLIDVAARKKASIVANEGKSGDQNQQEIE